MTPQVAILIGAALATIGWLYAARRARTLARKQHTINVILQANFNARFLDARARIAPLLRSGTCPAELMEDTNEEIRRDFRDILNHYEFVSAGLRNGDFDEKLVKDSERGTYIALFTCCEPYIWKLRDGRRRMTIYEHLEWVYRRWEEAPPSTPIRIFETIRGRPIYGRPHSHR